MRPTIQDVADRAGVSKSTASCALRNSPLVARETIDRVRAAAEVLDYRTNPLKSLMMGAVRGRINGTWSPTIALLNYYGSKKAFRSIEGFSDRVKGARERARSLGYGIEEFQVNVGEVTQARLQSILRARGIYGVIIPHIPIEVESVLLDTDWSEMAVSVMGWAYGDRRIHRAGGYQSHNMRAVYDKLTGKGYNKIGCSLNLSANRRVDYAWRSGFIEAQLVHGGDFKQDSLFSFVDDSFAESFNSETEARFRRWLSSFKPDALIINSKREYDVCRDLGLRVPEDIGVALLVSKPQAMGGFSGMDRNNYKIGAAAVDLVVEQFSNNELGLPDVPKTVLVDGRWVDGITLRS